MKVFEPFKINQMELKNRMVVSAMVTNYCSEDGMATEKFIAYHEHKAKGGWGLIITEDYAVTPTAGGFKKLPGLWEDGQIESHKKLTKRIHEAGGKIAAQIYHAGRETSSAITGEQPIGPSALKDPTMPETPREMTVEEIHELIEQFGDCARRAKEAGFDAVEVHGAHGYLIGAFASPFSNKRSDEYGGTIRNRARFAMEIIENIKKKCGKDYPVLYRMSAVEYVSGGLEIEESKVLARLVEEAGADCIHCSQGVYASTHVIIPPSVVPRAAYVENAAEIKKVVDIPVIAVGRINDVEIAESVLQADKADLVTVARASLADPDMPKKVVVVGGGVSGCEAAVSAAMKGHKVTLIEQSNRLGGQWIPAAVPIGKGEFTSLIIWQKQMLDKLGVNVLLNTKADKEMIESYQPDTVIIATGSKPFVPPIKGTDQDFVTNAHEVLLGNVETGENIVVIGGGLVGAETADMLAEQNKQITIIEMLPQIMK